MREIKFRAWIPSLKKIMKVKGINLSPTADFMKFTVDVGRKGYFMGVNPYTGEEFVKLMQFTGLLDKNGKEIYEGDIVKEDAIISVNPYKNVIFTKKVEWDSKKSGFNLGKGMYPPQYEVIGNIYSNPELVER